MYFFSYFFTLLINTLLMILFMHKKNVFSEEIFFCQQVDGHSRFVTTTCHRHVTQNEKISPCIGHSCRFQNFTTSGRHYDMSATCRQHFQLRLLYRSVYQDFESFYLIPVSRTILIFQLLDFLLDVTNQRQKG